MLPVLEQSKSAKNSLIFQKCAKCILTLMFNNMKLISDYTFRFHTSKMNEICLHCHWLYFSSITVCTQYNCLPGQFCNFSYVEVIWEGLKKRRVWHHKVTSKPLTSCYSEHAKFSNNKWRCWYSVTLMPVYHCHKPVFDRSLVEAVQGIALSSRNYVCRLPKFCVFLKYYFIMFWHI